MREKQETMGFVSHYCQLSAVNCSVARADSGEYFALEAKI
jgi:hypothetical protein